MEVKRGRPRVRVKVEKPKSNAGRPQGEVKIEYPKRFIGIIHYKDRIFRTDVYATKDQAELHRGELWAQLLKVPYKKKLRRMHMNDRGQPVYDLRNYYEDHRETWNK